MNKQFSIDSFLDWEGLHWDFSLRLHLSVSVPSSAFIYAAKGSHLLIMMCNFYPLVKELGGKHSFCIYNLFGQAFLDYGMVFFGKWEKQLMKNALIPIELTGY